MLANALSCAANAIFLTDRTGHIVWANEAFCRLSGYSLQEVLGYTPAMVNSGMQSDSFYADLWRTILTGNAWRGRMVERRKNGALYSVEETITPLRDEQGVITHFIAIQLDMTLQKEGSEHEREHYLAYHDVLTGLPNRTMFVNLEQQALSYAKREQLALALLFLDLDRFKEVNDVFGHIVGDRLLLAVAERLMAAIRKSDTVARFGGDEFAILIPNLADTGVAVNLARKLTAIIAQPFRITERELHIGVSIGIAIYPDDGDTPEELMKKADEAMYRAKKNGGNTFRFPDRHTP
ncbi:sensor domain-containing diguanylate cyclase [Noviherbaspirillum cavernae]|uniref:Sensor domain-containing diguanylate cyclase n=2 Tax=Noviherbaspirillum cavernae TaxID=2320862 RepID=A0A418X636_9BURK|nr:sensor domain-containing diguanylate cyclase [Noviherbaspirillum cavernae]